MVFVQWVNKALDPTTPLAMISLSSAQQCPQAGGHWWRDVQRRRDTSRFEVEHNNTDASCIELSVQPELTVCIFGRGRVWTRKL